MAKKPAPRSSKLSVYLYVPNIIGYIRVLLNCLAFSLCLRNKIIFPILYFFRHNLAEFVLPVLYAMLWMAGVLEDSIKCQHLELCWIWISTACLLVVLSQLYRPGLIFLSLLALDIGSHWFQMYSTFLAGKASHKDVKDSTNWLFRAYYGNRMFMAYCCVSCEVLYLILFYLAENQTETLTDVSIFSVLLMLFR
ncbi:hypothetical protein TSUD_91120 [Trifolium subterraneum]|uniref:CDP-diacylglycerol--inositol 3-phosphatidyltransferase n=1 Tax=Trifolium subterraneum TaxID=3900 RepID=A0A2Z6P0R5_TRISU|nr:hypothetical protein TSUD_91120 [Trifolium subterraneum]